jgi:circadian clock protein KaiB
MSRLASSRWTRRTRQKAVIEVNAPLLRLYIAGKSPSSQRAEQNLDKIRSLISAHFTFEIVDVLSQPELAENASILATPTLSYEHTERPRRIVGDISDTKKALEFLGIECKEKTQ